MKMFMMKSFCIFVLMFISIAAGIQMAHDGINKMKGYNNPHFKNFYSLQEGKYNNRLSGDDVSSHDLAGKQQKLEKMNAFNLFSFIGKKMSEGISATSEKLIKSIAR